MREDIDDTEKQSEDKIVVVTSEGEHRAEIAQTLAKECSFEPVFVDDLDAALKIIQSDNTQLVLHDWEKFASKENHKLHQRIILADTDNIPPRMILCDAVSPDIVAVAGDTHVERIIASESFAKRVAVEISTAVEARKEMPMIKRRLMALGRQSSEHYEQTKTDSLIEDAYKAYPDDPFIQLQYGTLKFRQGENEAAEEIVNEILARHKDYVGAMALLARILMKRSDFVVAENLLKRADLLSPCNSKRLIMLGDLFYSRNDPDSARKYYQSSVESSPGDKDAVLSLAKFEISENNLNSALEVFSNCCSEEQAVATLNNAGVLEVRQNRFQDALKLYDLAFKSMKTNKYKPSVLFNSALACRRLGRYEEALGYLDEIVKENPKASKAIKHKDEINSIIAGKSGSSSNGESRAKDKESLREKSENLATEIPPKDPPPDGGYPGEGIINVSFSQDKTIATICKFDPSVLDKADLVLDAKWLKNEVARLQLITSESKLVNSILKKIKAKEDLNGQILVAGARSEAPADPVLVRAKERMQDDKQECCEIRDFREARSDSLVKAGDHLADIVYESPGIAGYTVFGERIAVPDAEPFEITLGENVKKSGENGFVATADGQLHMDIDSISVTSTYLHEGDVDLASGNVVYDGSVTISGGVQAEAEVFARGDVTVKDTIGAGSVVCRGNLDAQGIVTGLRGRVLCNGDINCDFIENSRVFCRGSITVNKAIINSTVYAEGSITLQSSSATISGSDVKFWERLAADTIGYQGGTPTTIHMGCKWTSEQRHAISKQRREKLKYHHRRMSGDFKELKRRKTRSSLSPEKGRLYEQLERSLPRLENILARLHTRIETKKEFNDKAVLEVEGSIETTVTFRIGDKEINPGDVMTSTVVCAQKKGNSFFKDLHEYRDQIAKV